MFKINILLFGILQTAQASNRQMSEFTRGVLTALIPLLIINIISIIITAKITIRQFYSKRWWEKKETAYSQILEILAELEFSTLKVNSYVKGELPLDNEAKKKCAESLQKVMDSLGKVFIIGTHTISNDAFKTLVKLGHALGELKVEDDFISFMDKSGKLIFECIREIKNCEKKDLKIK